MQEEVIFQTSSAEIGIMQREAMLLYVKRGLLPRFSNKLLVLLGIQCVLVVGTLAGTQMHPPGSVLLALLTIFLIPWLVNFLFYVGIGIVYTRGMKKTDQRSRFFFLPELFYEQSGERRTEIVYDNIKSVRQRRDCFLIYMSNDQVYVVGRNDFRRGNPSEFIEFLEKAKGESWRNRKRGSVESPAAGTMEEGEVKYFVRTELTQEIFEMASVLAFGVNVRHNRAKKSLGSTFALWIFEIALTGIPILGYMWAKNIRNPAAVGIAAVICVVITGVIVWKDWRKKEEAKVYDEKFLTQARNYYKSCRSQGILDQPCEYIFCANDFRIKNHGITSVHNYWEIKEMYESRRYLFFWTGSTVEMLHKQDLAESVEEFKTFLEEKSQTCRWQQIQA